MSEQDRNQAAKGDGGSRRRRRPAGGGNKNPTATNNEMDVVVEDHKAFSRRVVEVAASAPAADSTPKQPIMKKPRVDASSSNVDSSKICRFFQKGDCRRGAECNFLHVSAGTEPVAVNTLVVPAKEDASDRKRKTKPVTDAAIPAAAAAPAAVSVEKKNDRNKKPNKTHEPVAVEAVVEAPKVKAVSPEAKQLKHMSDQKFADLPISALTKKAIAEIMQYENMTQVQAQSLPKILQHSDCLAKAKTGTGKTLAFLIPAIENMLRQQASKGKTGSNIPILVISPTRELASQIAEEANILLKFHAQRDVLVMFGGTNINKDKTALRSDQIAILIATPGRLLDHLQQNTQNLQQRLAGLQTLIFDEADQLLDMGFKPDIDRIMQFLPSKDARQTLLFSATVSKAIQDIARLTLRSGYVFVDTVGEEDAGEQTHEHVSQTYHVAPMGQMFPALVYLLQSHMAKNTDNFKVIVFFTTARLAGFNADLCNNLAGFPNIIQIHSRLSQAQRTKASDAFRDSTNVIMFSSDVSARGMDYPDVSLVLQVGSTEKAQYIHRLGRTARAGKEGQGILLLNEFEESSMLQELRGLPLQRSTESMALPAQHPTVAMCNQVLAQMSRNRELKKSAEQAYQAWLGYYNGKLRVLKWGKDQLVATANQYATSCGLTETPALQKKTIGKMGLKGVPGLRIAAFEER